MIKYRSIYFKFQIKSIVQNIILFCIVREKLKKV
jgi:hypothetical protein